MPLKTRKELKLDLPLEQGMAPRQLISAPILCLKQSTDLLILDTWMLKQTFQQPGRQRDNNAIWGSQTVMPGVNTHDGLPQSPSNTKLFLFVIF